MNSAFDRSQIKKQAKSRIKINYWRNVFIAFLAVLTIAGALDSFLLNIATGDSDVSSGYAWDLIVHIIRFYKPEFLTGGDALNDFLYSLGAEGTSIITENFSFPFYVADSIVNSLDTVNKIWMAIFAILFYLVFILFVVHPLHVGTKNHFYRQEHESSEKNALISGGFNKFYTNIVMTKALKSVLYFLWSLTVVMAPVKYYSYYYVDYILCDNPTLSPIKAIRLSKEMTKGQKWNLFKKDLSLLGYWLLSELTIGLFGFFFYYPYKEIVDAKIYIELKQKLFVTNPEAFKNGFQTFDGKAAMELIDRTGLDYRCDYKIVDYILLFFAIGCIGWIWEVFYNFIQTHAFANRGTLWGPILPIYGSGGVVALIVLRKARNKPWLSFILSIVLCLTIEYLTAWYFETFKNVRYWSYDDMPFNIQGRICLFGGLAFGIGCIAVIYFVGPLLYKVLKQIPTKIKWIASGVLIAAIITDLTVSHFYPNPAGQVAVSSISWLLPGLF